MECIFADRLHKQLSLVCVEVQYNTGTDLLVLSLQFNIFHTVENLSSSLTIFWSFSVLF